MEAEKYKVGMAHMKEVLWDIQFVTDRIMTVANKVINDVSRYGLSDVVSFRVVEWAWSVLEV